MSGPLTRMIASERLALIGFWCRSNHKAFIVSSGGIALSAQSRGVDLNSISIIDARLSKAIVRGSSALVAKHTCKYVVARRDRTSSVIDKLLLDMASSIPHATLMSVVRAIISSWSSVSIASSLFFLKACCTVVSPVLRFNSATGAWPKPCCVRNISESLGNQFSCI